MAGKKKQRENVRKIITGKLTECEDRADIKDHIMHLRRMRYRFEKETIYSLAPCEEIIQNADELIRLFVKKDQRMVELYLARLEALTDAAYSRERKEKGRMSLLSKLKAVVGGNKEDPQNKLLQKQEEDIDQKIFRMEKKIIELSDQRNQQMQQFKEEIKKCASLDEKSPEYKLTRQKASTLHLRIKNIERNIDMYADQLLKNSEYQMMLETGRLTFEMSNYMPDPAEADLLMQQISDKVGETADDMKEFGQKVSEYSRKIEKTKSGFERQENEELDQLIQAERQELSGNSEKFDTMKTEDKSQAEYSVKSDSETSSLQDQLSKERVDEEDKECNLHKPKGELI